MEMYGMRDLVMRVDGVGAPDGETWGVEESRGRNCGRGEGREPMVRYSFVCIRGEGVEMWFGT